jgi:inner membrane protein
METAASSIWQKSKPIVKGLMIAFIALLLLIPSFLVQDLIKEREARQKEAVTEVSSKWANRQNITGPMLVIPYTHTVVDGEGKTTIKKSFAFFLPDKLNIQANVKPEKRYRGIYEVMLYTSTITMNGSFSPLPLEKIKLTPSELNWSEAYLCMNISDVKGLKDELQMQWNDSNLILSPAYLNNGIFTEGFMSPVAISDTVATKGINFSAKVNVNGSEQILFTPTGRESSVELQSSWPDPSFTGNQLPETRAIQDSGFIAKWKSLSHTRNFPQAWKDESYNLSTASFGADLFIPVNGYQKTMRSVKYAILCILLTFTAFFLIETNYKRSVHPLQYGLIGLALVLFYTLLLSFSEYIGFNSAYAIAAVATIGLIAWFVKGLLGTTKLTLVLSFVLVLLYSYVFTILQLQDYSLLIGSVGLFLTLAIIMYYSKKLQW